MFTVAWATVWYSLKAVIPGLLRVPRVPGGVYDQAGSWWARRILAASGAPVGVEGVEHLAGEGPRVIASNHASLFDILVLLAHLPVPVKFVAKKELFAIPLYGRALAAAGHVRLNRARAREAFDVYAEAARMVRANSLTMLIFAEGTRTRTGELLPFKKGPFVLAIQAGAPVVPCYIAHTFGIQPKGSFRIRPQPIRVLFGEPIAVDGMTVDDRGRLCELVEQAVHRLKARVDSTPGAR
jgi:1-acyl-sn-glycerol-3-phosphate acyltransferase